MSKYLVLIYEREQAWADAGAADRERTHTAHNRFRETNDGAIVGGDALQPTGTATSLRHEPSGEITVTDGPFAETKEALGGYYVLDAADLDEAIALARQVPVLTGGVEVRPVLIVD